jgi:hypothetical protein
MHAQTTERRTFVEDAVLHHVARYRLTVPEAVQHLAACRGRSRGDVLRTLSRLETQRRLTSVWLYAGRRGYVAKDDKKQAPSQRAPASGLSETAKVRHFAMLAFCCLGSAPRQRLTRAELVARIDGLKSPDCTSPYYAEADRIGFLRVDAGGHGRWDRILAKSLEDARDHTREPVWRPWIDAGRFEITIVTALPQKAERLCRAMAALDQAPPVPVRITALPELLYLIAPPPS